MDCICRTFIQTKVFSKAWDALGFDDENLRQLENMIISNPKRFPVIQGTGGLRKMRFDFDNEGKSGGVRICYIDFDEAETTYLMLVYPKNKKENLTASEKNIIKKRIDDIRRELEKNNE